MGAEAACPKCGGRMERSEFRIPDRVEVRVPLLGSVSVPLKGHVPEKLRGARAVAAMVCESCGYVELYLVR